jgi:hypothetical protein
MKIDQIVALESGMVRLIDALDGRDADAILTEAQALKPVLLALRAQSVWPTDELSRPVFDAARRRVEAARLRVNKLTELNLRRVENLTGGGKGQCTRALG